MGTCEAGTYGPWDEVVAGTFSPKASCCNCGGGCYPPYEDCPTAEGALAAYNAAKAATDAAAAAADAAAAATSAEGAAAEASAA